jgi:hypothetical protein
MWDKVEGKFPVGQGGGKWKKKFHSLLANKGIVRVRMMATQEKVRKLRKE